MRIPCQVVVQDSARFYEGYLWQYVFRSQPVALACHTYPSAIRVQRCTMPITLDQHALQCTLDVRHAPKETVQIHM